MSRLENRGWSNAMVWCILSAVLPVKIMGFNPKAMKDRIYARLDYLDITDAK